MNLTSTASRRPILVTGSHRSGTTWAGLVLNSSRHLMYVSEPFHLTRWPQPVPHEFRYWFQCITSECDGDLAPMFDRLMAGHFPLRHNLAQAGDAHRLKLVLREQLRFWRRNVLRQRLLLKDPIALFSAEWLAQRYDADVLVMIRHPAAFCSSIKLKNWHYDFSHMLQQPEIMQRYLEDFRQPIERLAREPADIIEQGILLWNCVHHTIDLYRSRHADWLFRRHEDLSVNPVVEFADIFRRFDVPFDGRSQKAVMALSGQQNPTEQVPGREFVRNSVANVKNWRNRLSDAEVARIRKGTERVAGRFYQDGDW